jgi:hypothetical protein
MRFSELSPQARRTYIEEAAGRKGISADVVEKDAWVSWVLRALFEDKELEASLLFKGGTSLSKVYELIDRFSEDIDLGIQPARLGIDEATLANAPTRTNRDQLHRRLQELCSEYLQEAIMPRLDATAERHLGKCSRGSWFRMSGEQGVLLFGYPTSRDRAEGYIERTVKLEFGSLTDQRPLERCPTTTLLTSILGVEFQDLVSHVRTLQVVRTFWEKATILHDCSARPTEKRLPPRYARHYSDFASLWHHRGIEWATDRVVLEAVVRHKTLYFSSSWSRYEEVFEAGLRLLPSAHRMDELRSDYESMRVMFLAPPPPFQEVCRTLAEAERAINVGLK